MKTKPTSDAIQEIINKLIYEQDADLKDIFRACYSHAVEKWMILDSSGRPEAPQWGELVDAMEFFIDEDTRREFIEFFNHSKKGS